MTKLWVAASSELTENGVRSMTPSAREASKPGMVRMPSMPSTPKKVGS